MRGQTSAICWHGRRYVLTHNFDNLLNCFLITQKFVISCNCISPLNVSIELCVDFNFMTIQFPKEVKKYHLLSYLNVQFSYNNSISVFLCCNIEEAETAFTRILGKRNGLGLINESVLVQEFLVGKEYVIDKV